MATVYTQQQFEMQAPLRAVATYPLYRGAQNALLHQPATGLPSIFRQAGRNALAPVVGNALAN